MSVDTEARVEAVMERDPPVAKLHESLARARSRVRASGKRTLAVMLGYRLARAEFVGLLAVAYAVPVAFWLALGYSPVVLLPLLSAPLAAAIARVVVTHRDGDALNPALERTGQLLAVYALLFAAGFVAGVS